MLNRKQADEGVTQMRRMQIGLVAATTMLLAGCQGAPSTKASSSVATQETGESVSASSSVARTTGQDVAVGGVDGASSRLGVVARTNIADYAIGVLEQAAVDDHPQLRANALEGLQLRPDIARAYLRNALVDQNRGVRFVAAMTIGRLKLAELAPLVEPLLLDESKSVRAAAMFALHQSGQRVDLNPLATMIRSDDPEVRANAAMVLGELEEPSAAPMIQQVLGEGLDLASPAKARIVDLQLAEALVKLGKTDQIQAIRAALFLPPDFQEITALAATMLGRLGDAGSAASLQRLIDAEGEQRRPAEVRMAAAMALAQLGYSTPIDVVAPYVSNDQLSLRLQAAIALGWMATDRTLPLLSRLIEDRNPLVQVAAASSIIRLERRANTR